METRIRGIQNEHAPFYSLFICGNGVILNLIPYPYRCQEYRNWVPLRELLG